MRDHLKTSKRLPVIFRLKLAAEWVGVAAASFSDNLKGVTYKRKTLALAALVGALSLSAGLGWACIGG